MLKDGQILFVRVSKGFDATEFVLIENVGGAHYYFLHSVPHWKFAAACAPKTQIGVLLDFMQRELKEIIERES